MAILVGVPPHTPTPPPHPPSPHPHPPPTHPPGGRAIIKQMLVYCQMKPPGKLFYYEECHLHL